MRERLGNVLVATGIFGGLASLFCPTDTTADNEIAITFTPLFLAMSGGSISLCIIGAALIRLNRNQRNQVEGAYNEDDVNYAVMP